MKKIFNTSALARTPLRKKALAILEGAYQSLDTQTIIHSAVRREEGILIIQRRRWDLTRFKRVYVVGVGKSAYQASRALVSIIGPFLTKGFILDIQGRSFGHVVVHRGTHPLPSTKNIRATRELEQLLEQATANDLVIVIISGGSSALLCQPTTMSVEEEIDITRTLMHRGATIQEMNIVRKHCSRMRGGNLSRAAYPARVVSLIFSDVCGNDLGTIGSGPTVYDSTTIVDAQQVLTKYKIPLKDLLETPKEKKYFRTTTNLLVASNITAVQTMSAEARHQGFTPRVYSTTLQGIASTVGARLVRECQRGEALIAAGETTVIVRGKGSGGRNQELVLSTLSKLHPGVVVASIASDGRDNTDAAGAIADITTTQQANIKKLDAMQYLRNNDAYHFFQKTNDLIIATNTSLNVSDLMVVIKE